MPLCPSRLQPHQPAAPHIALWMLRLLTSAQGLSKFVRKDEFASDELAHALGLGHWVCPDDRAFSPQAVRAELHALRDQAEQQADAAASLPEVLKANVQRLSALVELEAVDAQILAFSVCLHADPLLYEAADLLGPLSSGQVAQSLARVLNLPEPQVRLALGGQGLLAHTGMVTLDQQGSNLLRGKLDLLSPSFADAMVSWECQPAELLHGKLNTAAPARLALADYRHVQPMLDIMRSWLQQALSTRRRGVNLLLYGPPGTGKTELTSTLAQDLDCNLFEVAIEDEDRDPISGGGRLRALRAAQCLLAQSKALLVFDEVEDVFSDSLFRRSVAQSHKGWVNRMLENNAVPTLWLSNDIHCLDPAFIRRFDMVLELPTPPRSQRARMLQAHCGDLLDARQLQRLAEVEQLTPAIIARASTVAAAMAPTLGQAASAQAFEQLVGHTLQAQGHGRLPRPQAQLPALYDPAFVNADADLNALAQGLVAAQAAGGGARLCLYGPPGTGKTAFGRWLAEQLDRPLLVRRASDLLSMFVGEAEKNLARAFRQAEDEGALLLIDEVDSFLQDRRGAQRSWELTQVNEMLTQMEDFAGVFIASTNLMTGLDPAALRRFDLKVCLDYLRPEQAWALLERHCAQLDWGPPDALLRPRLARLRQLTPGDFAAVMRQQRFRPLADAVALVAALEAECVLKEGAKGVMGFV